MVITALFSPAFSHEGVTILLYFPTGNPLTLESILYGLSAGAMLATVMLWFLNFNRVMTSDKFIYLFGRIIPAMSLVLSMTLRFIPKFKTQMDTVMDAQRSIGRDISQGSLWQRTKIAITVLSIMVTWALGNAIETADSMKSQGYGLKGRSAFSIYRLDERDKAAIGYLLYLVLSGALGVFLAAIGRRSAPSAMLQIPVKQRKLSKRTLVAAVLIVLCIPLTIFAGVVYLGNQHYNITAILVLIECMLPFFLVFESRKSKARELVTIAVLCASVWLWAARPASWWEL